jgi:hypothetical protein
MITLLMGRVCWLGCGEKRQLAISTVPTYLPVLEAFSHSATHTFRLKHMLVKRYLSRYAAMVRLV